MRVTIQFEPRDLWIGVYWNRGTDMGGAEWLYKVYICLLPMLPIFISWTRRRQEGWSTDR